VNVAPVDLPHAETTLRHQLRTWGGQVARVIYTLDLAKSPGPRGVDYEQHRPAMEQLIERLAATSPTYRAVTVDYSPEAVGRVGAAFFAGASPPTKDCYGAPFYAYFDGLASVDTRYVLHMDSDMLFGGGSQTWIGEAIELLESRSNVLFVAPFGGPPSADPRVTRKERRRELNAQPFGSLPVLESVDPRTKRFGHVGSRIFFTDLDRLRGAGPFSAYDAPPWSRGSNLATTPFLPAESTLSAAMRDGGWVRLDYLGTGAGMWRLHPAQRGSAYAANLPHVIAALERGAIPDYQRGSSALRTAWLNAVGPELIEEQAAPLHARGVARKIARATRVLRLRDAVWRMRWRRANNLGRGEHRKSHAGRQPERSESS
jgi:hypothetical protein